MCSPRASALGMTMINNSVVKVLIKTIAAVRSLAPFVDGPQSYVERAGTSAAFSLKYGT